MPIYSLLLAATSAPKDPLQSLRLEEENGISFSKQCSRLVRENCCLWALEHLNSPEVFDTSKQEEIRDEILHGLALVLEMVAACEAAGEDLCRLFLIKHVLISCMPLMELLADGPAQHTCSEYSNYVWEIISFLMAKSKGEGDVVAVGFVCFILVLYLVIFF